MDMQMIPDGTQSMAVIHYAGADAFEEYHEALPEWPEIAALAWRVMASLEDATVTAPNGNVELRSHSEPLILSMAAAVGMPHPKWQERPVAFIVPRPDTEIDVQAVRDFIAPRIASWWMPDEIVLIEEIPKTGTGKFDKKVVRDQYKDLLLESDGGA